MKRGSKALPGILPGQEQNTIKVYQTQLAGYCGPVVWRTIEGAIGELQGMILEMAPGDSFTITIAEMTRAEFEALPEFAGY